MVEASPISTSYSVLKKGRINIGDDGVPSWTGELNIGGIGGGEIYADEDAILMFEQRGHTDGTARLEINGVDMGTIQTSVSRKTANMDIWIFTQERLKWGRNTFKFTPGPTTDGSELDDFELKNVVLWYKYFFGDQVPRF